MNIAFIPARCGSKTIPFKNIKNICGMPLIFWSLKALSNASKIDKIFVATDCDEIKNVVLNFEFKKVEIFERNKENANDTASTESVMLEFINSNIPSESDLFILAQATSPLTRSEDFDEAIEKLLSNDQIDSILSCVVSKRFFWEKDGTPINYDYFNRPRRQDFNGLLMENGAFYINSIHNIKKFKNRLAGKIFPYLMPHYSSFELDDLDDWLITEKLMYKYVVNNHPKKLIKLFATDVDGVLTDAGMYYDNNGNEMKKFNTHDGMSFQLLRDKGVKTAIITGENTKLVKFRSKKLNVDYLFQGVSNEKKIDVIKNICRKEKIKLSEVAYIGDDINDKETLSAVGIAACPKNATMNIKKLNNIIHLKKSGGDGAVREFVELILSNQNAIETK